MATTEVSKGKSICGEGQPLEAIHIIIAGSVRASFPGGELILKKGDVVGLCDIAYDSHFFSYTLWKILLSSPIRSRTRALSSLWPSPIRTAHA